MESKLKSSAICIVMFCMSIVLFVCCQIQVGSNASSYFPTKEGLKWEYQLALQTSLLGNIAQIPIITSTTFATRRLNSTTVVPIKFEVMEQSHFVFIGQNDDGIYEHAIQTEVDTEPKVHPVPKYYLKNPVKVGTNWTLDTETVLLSNKYSIKLNAVIESTDATVTVPAGTFKNCVKVKMSGSKSIKRSFRGNLKIVVVEYDWYAPGVGSVKSIREENSGHTLIGSGIISMQLKSHK
jgi:hypothetical protein